MNARNRGRAPVVDRFSLTDVDLQPVIPQRRGSWTTHKPSDQQTQIYYWVRQGKGNLMIRARAGCGKTTTIIDACSFMSGSIALAAYNKAISVEIGDKLTQRGLSAFSGTFHSFGYRALRRAFPKIKVDRDKMWKIIHGLDVAENLEGFVFKAVSLAKQRGFGVLEATQDTSNWRRMIDHFNLDETLSGENLTETRFEELIEEGIDLSKQALYASNEMTPEFCDFDDMIHGALYHNVRVWQNDWLLVDEAQDTNPARRALAKKMLKPGGRAIFVGDEHQAIYGFTGADNDSMDIIQREFSCTDLPLTVTYRCPKRVVQLANTWVKDIEAHPSAPDGAVQRLSRKDFNTLPPTALTVNEAVLCRYTKPLVETAFALIKRSIPCHVEGRDIGSSLIQLTKRWKVTRLSALKDKLEAYRERESQKLMGKGKEQKAESITDRVETLIVIINEMSPLATIDDLRVKINSLFGDTPDGQPPQNLTLSTVHRSKGREWNRVYLLGRESYMPSKFARQQWQVTQEINLMYVAVTRAKETLVEVSAR